MHYQPHQSRLFLKIVMATPNLVAQARGGAFLLLPFMELAAFYPRIFRLGCAYNRVMQATGDLLSAGVDG